MALMNGRLSNELDQAIRLADENISDDYNAMLVQIPEVHLYFFLFSGARDESVLIVSSTYSASGLAPLSVLSPTGFAEGLRKLPRVVGIEFP